MKKLLTPVAALSLLFLAGCGNNDGTVFNANGDPQLNPNNIERIIGAMTEDEKIDLVVGTGMAGFDDSAKAESPVVGATRNLVPGAAGTTCPIPRLGIPAIVLADGPAGLRISPTREGTDSTFYATAFPVGTLLASTWDVDLVGKVGEAMGNEVLEYGCDVLLGPGMNIHRNPLCGRNFEYYSEDPLLSGKMAASMVNGVQSNGVGVSTKHFDCNNQETHRMGNDAIVSRRALREIYLKGFEIAVKEAQPWTIMTSYNKINGTYAAESKELLDVITRGEWGFEGMVMTDWLGGKDAARSIAAGNDLLMPGLPMQKDRLRLALKDSTLTVKELDDCVRRVLQLVVKTPRFKGYKYSNAPDLKAHADVTRSAACEGTVLLKNDGSALPFGSDVKNVAVFGSASYMLVSGGTGSGDVNEAYVVSIPEGLENAGYKVDGKLSDAYNAYKDRVLAERDRKYAEEKNSMKKFMPKGPFPEMKISGGAISAAAASDDAAIFTIGRSSGEFFDRKPSEGDFLLTADELSTLTAVCDAFHSVGKKVVVVLNVGGVIETASWKKLPDAVLLAWQGGEEAGNSVGDIIKGAVNPSGKLPMTFPVNFADHESSKNFPVVDPTTDMKALMGMAGGPQTSVKDVDYTDYAEGIWVGYRCFDHFGRAVSYPFGYGLSYTTFEYSGAVVGRASDGVYTVTVNVANTGAVAGREVVELYVAAPAGTLEKPVKELKAFAKTPLIQPGEKVAVTLTFAESSLASFDESVSAWVVDAGDYKAIVASSSAASDAKATLDFKVAKASSVKVADVLKRQ